jgi:hypothetical protein
MMIIIIFIVPNKVRKLVVASRNSAVLIPSAVGTSLKLRWSPSKKVGILCETTSERAELRDFVECEREYEKIVDLLL